MTVQNRLTFIEKLRRKSEKSFGEAKLLFEQGFYEGAISRAYYAMFYLGKAVLATKDLSRQKHSAVIAAFGEHFANTGILPQELAAKIKEAFEERHEADYDFEISKTKEDAELVLKYADEFAKEVISYLDKWIEENRSNE